MGQQLANVNFDLIRYANCWEDADILLEGLQVPEGGQVLSVASAGDNSFSLLTQHPELVVAVDLSHVQLHLVALKKEAIRILDREAFLGFMGFTPSTDRLQTFQKLKSALSSETQAYWDYHQQQIQAGIIHQGKFEKYFQLFAWKILPWIHTPKRVHQLFQPKDRAAQERFYHKKWNSWRWQMLFKVFFSKTVMGRVGRDPEFLKQVEVPVASFIYEKAATELSSVQAQANYFLYYTLTGTFSEGLPHYVRPENYSLIQKNIDRLVLFEGPAEQALSHYPGITHMNLSNIFEYMDDGLFRQVTEQLLNRSAPQATFAYWNLMVPRELTQVFPTKIAHDAQRSDRLSEIDKGFFYRKFIIDQKL